MFPNFSLGERDGRSYSALWPQVGVGQRKQRWRPCDGENSSQKARLGYAFILWGFLAKLKDAGFLTALISAVFGGRYCGCRGLGGRSNGRKANDQTSLPTVAGRTAQLGPCHQGISDIVVTSVWLPSKCCPIKITDIWQRSDVRKRRLYDHLPLRFFEDARKAGTKWWFLARLSCLLVPFFLVWFVWWLGGFLHIFYFHPENWERCSPILTTFAYFSDGLVVKNHQLVCVAKNARPERQVTARWPASFSDTVLRSSKAPCIESHSQILDHGRIGWGLWPKRTWLLKSVILRGGNLTHLYIYMRIFRTSRYKDPYYITNYIVWWNADSFYFIFFRCSIGHFRLDKSTKAKVKCPDHHCQVFSREAAKILMRCRGADFLVTQIYKRIPTPSIFDSNF